MEIDAFVKSKESVTRLDIFDKFYSKTMTTHLHKMLNLIKKNV